MKKMTRSFTLLLLAAFLVAASTVQAGLRMKSKSSEDQSAAKPIKQGQQGQVCPERIQRIIDDYKRACNKPRGIACLYTQEHEQRVIAQTRRCLTNTRNWRQRPFQNTNNFP